MRVIALIEEPGVIQHILEHLGLWAPLPAERSPPVDPASWPPYVLSLTWKRSDQPYGLVGKGPRGDMHTLGAMELAMNRIEIEVLGSRAALTAFARAWRQTSVGRKTTPLAFGSIAELFSAVTQKRLELIRYVAANEGLQIRPLARALGRDYKNVHTDVQALIEFGLLEKDESGGLKAPFDEIVIRAGLREAA